MQEYLVPTGYGEAEFIEKKSRFIGRAWLVETLHNNAQVNNVEYTADGIEIETLIDDILYGRLKDYVTQEL